MEGFFSQMHRLWLDLFFNRWGVESLICWVLDVGCVCILYIELMHIVVVEIFGFEISIVSDWYISVSLYFYVQTLFYSLEAMNLFGFMPEKYQKCFYCGDLLIGRNSLLNLPDRNGALHPDQLTFHAVVRRSLKSSYRFWFVWIVFIVFLSLSGEFCDMITGSRLSLL